MPQDSVTTLRPLIINWGETKGGRVVLVLYVLIFFCRRSAQIKRKKKLTIKKTNQLNRPFLHLVVLYFFF